MPGSAQQDSETLRGQPEGVWGPKNGNLLGQPPTYTHNPQPRLLRCRRGGITRRVRLGSCGCCVIVGRPEKCHQLSGSKEGQGTVPPQKCSPSFASTAIPLRWFPLHLALCRVPDSSPCVPVFEPEMRAKLFLQSHITGRSEASVGLSNAVSLSPLSARPNTHRRLTHGVTFPSKQQRGRCAVLTKTLNINIETDTTRCSSRKCERE